MYNIETLTGCDVGRNQNVEFLRSSYKHDKFTIIKFKTLFTSMVIDRCKLQIYNMYIYLCCKLKARPHSMQT